MNYFFLIGPHWRNMRRATHQLLSKEATREHFPIQQAEATMMLCNILEDPQVRYMKRSCHHTTTSSFLESLQPHSSIFDLRCIISGVWDPLRESQRSNHQRFLSNSKRPRLHSEARRASACWPFPLPQVCTRTMGIMERIMQKSSLQPTKILFWFDRPLPNSHRERPT